MTEAVVAALRALAGRPATASRLASMSPSPTDETNAVGAEEVRRVLAELVQNGIVRSHHYPPPDQEATDGCTLYWIPATQTEGAGSVTPTASSSDAPVVAAGDSPSKSNHLSKNVSAAIRSRTRGRRLSAVSSPFKSPLKRKEPDCADSKGSQALTTPAKQPRLETPENLGSGLGDLKRAIKAKEARLEELKRKRLLAEQKFSSQEEREKVLQLIAKWREVCQEVLVQLHTHHMQEKPDLTLAELVEYLNIDAEAIRFSTTDEAFY